jgi:hypothetical protein
VAETAPRCTCCGLQQKWVGAGLCSTCTYHQSEEVNQTAKRHREHEEMLRERLMAASEWARKAEEERKQFGQKMHWALKSRDRTIKVLREINDMHELRSDLSCTCGKPKGCKVAELLDDRGIQQLIRKVDDYEAEQQRKEQIWREIQRDPYAWEDYLRGADIEEAMGRRRDDYTA